MNLSDSENDSDFWYAALRCPEPATGVNTSPAALAAVLAAAGYSGRPRGRIGG